jgi:hypothetical protein
MADLTMMSGRWMWYGAQTFTQAQWDTLCKQAASWQMQGVHPKVADGTGRWYSDSDLLMLKRVAEQHGLRVVPYHYCYGPRFGTGQIAEEARISAWIGQVFGAVIPDIEDEYMSQDAAAASFGKQVRALFDGLWIPTLYANPVTHPVPMLSLNPSMDAWLPQVYFSVWNGLAQSAIDYVFPQWQAVDAQIRKAGQAAGLKPILPIISTGNGVDASQIATFIAMCQHYGYIGFWHSGTYAPYADAVISSPLPLIKQENTVNNVDQLEAAGWKYDPQTTIWTAPNGFLVQHGFAEAVSAAWNPQDYPLENEQHCDQLELSNPALGSGARQRFRLTTLEWTQARGVFRAWTGQELIELERRLQQAQSKATLSDTLMAALVAVQKAVSDTLKLNIAS